MSDRESTIDVPLRPPSATMEAPRTPDQDARELVEAAERKRGPRRRRRSSIAPPSPTTAPAVRSPRRREQDHETRGTDPVLLPVTAAEPTVQHAAPASDSTAQAPSAWWTMTAICTGLACVALAVFAAVEAPARPSVERMAFEFTSATRLGEREMKQLLSAFPERDNLLAPDSWTLRKLDAWLQAQDAIAAVERVAWDIAEERGRLRGILAIRLALRTPVLPYQLADGTQRWIAADGRLLPAGISAPPGARPALRGLERASAENRKEAAEAWAALSGRMAPGLLASIDLDATLDSQQRGIVMTTRYGTRIVWGRPDDARCGMTTERKADNLLHVLACQGDQSRVAEISVRWRQPTFRLKDAP